MSISSTKLTDACQKELTRIIGYVTDRELAALLKTEPAFREGGFRSNKPALLRKRLEQIVFGGQEISPHLRSLLAAHSRSSSLLTHLSVATLASTAPAWAALLGEHVFLTAALLDSRADLRKKAETWLERTPHFMTVEPEQALSDLAEILGDIREFLGASGSAPGPSAAKATKESWNEQREKLEQRIKSLQAETRRLKGVEDRHSRTNTLLEKEKEESDRLAKKLKENEQTLRKIRRELEETKAELQRETNRREERLQSAVDDRLSKEFHGWLAEAKSVEIEAHNPSASADVIALAEKALDRQAEVDRHSGNRRELTARLAMLEDLRQRVQDSLRNAIRQSPDLKRADRELEKEILHLRSLLNHDAFPSPIEEALIRGIHSVPDDKLPLLKTLPGQFRSLHLLSRDSLKTIESEFLKRLDSIEALGVPVDPELEGRKDAAALLGRALSGKLPAILLLDGHNVLFGLQARYMPPRGKAVPDKQKRQNLIDDVVRITRPNPALRAIVLFDGDTRSDSNPGPNVRVIYSGGEGEHRADRVIIDQIRFFKTNDPDANVLLVSNDNDLCKEARRLGAKDLAVLDFGAFL